MAPSKRFKATAKPSKKGKGKGKVKATPSVKAGKRRRIEESAEESDDELGPEEEARKKRTKKSRKVLVHTEEVDSDDEELENNELDTDEGNDEGEEGASGMPEYSDDEQVCQLEILQLNMKLTSCDL